MMRMFALFHTELFTFRVGTATLEALKVNYVLKRPSGKNVHQFFMKPKRGRPDVGGSRLLKKKKTSHWVLGAPRRMRGRTAVKIWKGNIDYPLLEKVSEGSLGDT
ncbi:hypothetical protein M407DRAFT_17784 [Tulasnella calospora MUT 4182]|uniref:Uncharacterized protein n=1 Tax=Tulasnella calospora MUT 4182 TaxID=1051891 RepID=A0A0C3QKV3_9AGAM|nr:hypothetical protein M407DRAFT_17784 [Tulasnella calospora MUT 4182]